VVEIHSLSTGGGKVAILGAPVNGAKLYELQPGTVNCLAALTNMDHSSGTGMTAAFVGLSTFALKVIGLPIAALLGPSTRVWNSGDLELTTKKLHEFAGYILNGMKFIEARPGLASFGSTKEKLKLCK
jgi:hypothetical protein